MEKWIFICMAVIFGILGAGASIEKYQIQQCKIVALQVNKSADEIEKICK